MPNFHRRFVALDKTNLRWRFRKILWASQNIWALKFTYCIHRNLAKVIIRLYNSTPFICKTSRLLSFNNFFWTILQSYLFAKFCISLCSQCSDKQKLCSLTLIALCTKLVILIWKLVFLNFDFWKKKSGQNTL